MALVNAKRVKQIRIADDHLLFRRGLRTLLSAEQDLEVLDEVATLDHAILRNQTQAPDLLLMNVELLQTASEADLLALRTMQERAPVLFLATTDEPKYLELAMKAGGRGYMLKNSAPAELLAGIRATARGTGQEIPVLSDTAADLHALAGMSGLARPSEGRDNVSRLSALTLREQEILKLLAEGRTVRETASELSLSVKTIEAHKLNLMRKLDIHNRAALIEFARQKGVIESAPRGLTHSAPRT